MAGVDNLKPLNTRTKTEQREIARQGGVASGVARRQKKTLAQIGEMIGNLGIQSDKNKEILREAGIAEDDLINDVGMMYRLNLKAQSGDTRAIELLAKLRGELKQDSPFAGVEVSSITINFGGKPSVEGER